MTLLSNKRANRSNCLAFVILVSLIGQASRVGYPVAVDAAPQKLNVDELKTNASAAATTPTDGISGRKESAVIKEQKTADLSLLINETLKINNKSATADTTPLSANDSKPVFRDDWTFDRVEYDLMDFLQELNARYQYANKSQGESESTELAVQNLTSVGDATRTVTKSQQQLDNQQETVTKTSIEAVKKELDAQDKHMATSTLPFSLASNDQDIGESTWQYGIFDRFTRAKPSSTTQMPDNLAASGSNTIFDMRLFNSDECGLRSYRGDPDYYPVAAPTGAESADMEEMTKELSQRRQRPPVGSFFSSHRKFHQTGSMGETLLGDEPVRDRPQDLLPPFDKFGGPTTVGNAASAEESNTSKYHKAQAAANGSSATGDGADDRAPPQDEFNLSLRRQWLQQQLGSTLQMLGLGSNGSFHALGDPGRSGPIRENMMKMSAMRSKLGKSVQADKLGGEPGTSVQPGPSVEPELDEQELKARQDELKLEARVIGGNDARLGDSPWSASLQALVSRPGTGGVEYRHYCGGTIISEYYILTAAHCLDFMVGRESRLFVVIGDLSWRMSPASMYGRRFGIEKLIIHGGYKSTAFGHDIGLIKTKESMKPLKVNGRYIINSVCLPEKNVEHTGEAELVGWGLFSNRNEMADSLQIADVPILPRPLCVDLYRRRTGLIQWLIGIELITEKQICAGTFGRGICQGDSGSALVSNEKVHTSQADRGSTTATGLASSRPKNMMRDQQQRATIIGVVAFGGIRRCSYQSLPGVYMQTSKYLDWILPRIQ